MDEDMASQVSFTPVTPEALARLTPAERDTFTTAAGQVACSQKPSMMTIAALVEIIQRLITEPEKELTAEGAGPLLSQACRDGDCWACEGAPCEHVCHRGGAR